MTENRARVRGVGGIFFKADDPQKLGAWYQRWLGLPIEHPYGASFQPGDLPEGSLSVWTPFDRTTEYFSPSDSPFMFNLIIDDLDGALEQVVEGGAERVGTIEDTEYGRFGWFIDPEGNKVELWEPRAQCGDS